jgi:hypothetical protein
MKSILAAAAMVLLPSIAHSDNPRRYDVCVGPPEHYRHDQKYTMEIQDDDPHGGGPSSFKCWWQSNTPSGRLIQKVCGSIIDLSEDHRFVCRIEGLFEITNDSQLNLIRATRVKVVPK